jgi:hypothetical protein
MAANLLRKPQRQRQGKAHPATAIHAVYTFGGLVSKPEIEFGGETHENQIIW